MGAVLTPFPRTAHLYIIPAVPVAPLLLHRKEGPASHPCPGLVGSWQRSQCLLALAMAKVRAWGAQNQQGCAFPFPIQFLHMPKAFTELCSSWGLGLCRMQPLLQLCPLPTLSVPCDRDWLSLQFLFSKGRLDGPDSQQQLMAFEQASPWPQVWALSLAEKSFSISCNHL